METIPTTVDLSGYLHIPDFTAKVIPASSLADRVKQSFEPTRETRHATMLSRKAHGLQFRPGELTCWAGFNGHRKSMFLSQVELDLCCQQRRVLVMSLEMLPVATMRRMVRQAAAVATPLPWQIDEVHRWTDGRLWLFDHIGRIDPEQAIALCRYFAERHDGTDVVIDSLMMVCGSEDTFDEQKQFVTDLCRVAQETGLHIHLIAHCRKPNGGDESKPPSKYDIRGTSAISDQAANVVMLWWNKAKVVKIEAGKADEEVLATPDFMMLCDKQRNGAWEGGLKFWFDDASLRFTEARAMAVEPYALLDIESPRAHFTEAA